MLGAVANQGVRLTSPVATIVAPLIAGVQTLWQQSNWVNQLGAKTAKIKRLKVTNGGLANTWLYIGTGLTAPTFVRAFRLRIIAGMNDDYEEGDLPDVEFAADITVWADAAAAAPNEVEVRAEIEEIG